MSHLMESLCLLRWCLMSLYINHPQLDRTAVAVAVVITGHEVVTGEAEVRGEEEMVEEVERRGRRRNP